LSLSSPALPNTLPLTSSRLLNITPSPSSSPEESSPLTHDHSTPHPYQIVSLNCAKQLATTHTTIKTHPQNSHCLILCLQEPGLLPDGYPSTDPAFTRHSPSHKPKCVMYVRKLPNIRTSIAYSCENAIIACKISLEGNQSFTVYNVYSRGGLDTFFTKVIRSLHPTPSCILLGDFNCHHPWWYADYGSPTQQQKTMSLSPNAYRIVDWLEDQDFQLINSPGVPTHYPSNGNKPSIIDLTFAHGAVGDNISTWRALHESTSDHSIITFDLSLPNSHLPKPSAPIIINCYKQANWDVFRQCIRDNAIDFEDVTESDTLDSKISDFYTVIADGLVQVVPTKTLATRYAGLQI
jgi:hypothetical protein